MVIPNLSFASRCNCSSYITSPRLKAIIFNMNCTSASSASRRLNALFSDPGMNGVPLGNERTLTLVPPPPPLPPSSATSATPTNLDSLIQSQRLLLQYLNNVNAGRNAFCKSFCFTFMTLAVSSTWHYIDLV